MRAFISNNWWEANSIVTAYQPKGATTRDTSMADLSGNLNATGTVGWDPKRGWVFSGSMTEYLDTGITPK